MVDEEASATEDLRAIIGVQSRLLDEGRRGSGNGVHALAWPERRSSWLGGVRNPLRALTAFRHSSFAFLGVGRRSNDYLPEEFVQRALCDVEDEHLARQAAMELLPVLKRRVGATMDVHCLVIGSGRHGRSVAGELLRRGCHVYLCDANPAILSAARVVIEAILFQHAREGLFAEGDVPAMLTRISLVARPLDALRCIPHVCIFEAVPEDVDLKRSVFLQAVYACIEANLQPSDVLLCSNTITIDLEEVRTVLPQAYAPCLVGARLLHPCWFVDDVEVTLPASPNDPRSSLIAVSTCSAFLESLGFRVGYISAGQLDQTGNPTPRRRLLYEEAVLYAMRQKALVEADAGETRTSDLVAELSQLSSQLARGVEDATTTGARASSSASTSAPPSPFSRPTMSPTPSTSGSTS